MCKMGCSHNMNTLTTDTSILASADNRGTAVTAAVSLTLIGQGFRMLLECGGSHLQDHPKTL